MNSPPNGRSWRVSELKYKEMLADNEVWFGMDGKQSPCQKRFLTNVKKGMTPMTLWKYEDVDHSQDATKKLKTLFGEKHFFDYPKPTKLINRMLQLLTDGSSNDIILDFFAGSGTTGHAVMNLNAEDGGNRKYILIQLPEKISEKSDAYKNGYRHISEITISRLKKAGEKILADNEASKTPKDLSKLDVGFKVATLRKSFVNRELIMGCFENKEALITEIALVYKFGLNYKQESTEFLDIIEITGQDSCGLICLKTTFLTQKELKYFIDNSIPLRNYMLFFPSSCLNIENIANLYNFYNADNICVF